jgi:hypothetical protein
VTHNKGTSESCRSVKRWALMRDISLLCDDLYPSLLFMALLYTGAP